MGHEPISAASTSSVGRIGDLTLDYRRRGDETVLVRSRCSSPWHFSPPIRLDDTACVYQPLVNPSGGLVAGDRLSLRATLGPRTHVLFSTPSANRVYRSAAGFAEQSAEITVEEGATLEWVPEPTIPFAGSRYRQRLNVRLARGATALVWDALASGRVARGERWAFAALDNDVRIAFEDRGRLIERSRVAPGRWRRSGMPVAAWNYAGTLLIAGGALGPERLRSLEGRMAAMVDECPGDLLGGVSSQDMPGLAVKLVANTAPALDEALHRLWGAARQCLWDLPAPRWRKY